VFCDGETGDNENWRESFDCVVRMVPRNDFAQDDTSSILRESRFGFDERLKNSVNFAILRTSFARERVSTMSEEAVKITVRPNGPLRVEGHILLTDADGKQWDLTGKPAVSLCRCGASEKRPFCDGSHNRVGFQCAASPAEILT
jgi:CDGSH-type Zn-finger protein